jgi:hypothetical protein
MRTFRNVIIGAVVGFVLSILIGKPIHDLIWSSDMEGDSGFFTVLIVMPLFTVLGGILGGFFNSGLSMRKTIVCISGVMTGAAIGLFIAFLVLKPIGFPFFLVLGLIFGGAVVGGICAGLMASKTKDHK